MSLSRSPMWTHRSGSPRSSVDRWTFSSPDAFLLLDGDARRIDLLLERGGPFEFLPGPEFDGRQPEWNTLDRNREARMHQDAANRVRSQTTRLVPSTVYALGDADRL